MKLIELAQLKTASFLALLGVIGSLSFSAVYLSAAEKAKETPVTIRLDLSFEEIMRRGSLPGRKAFTPSAA